ncbi:MAG: cupredoxin domain-containing protein [Solirubrobacterales bacterium]|nr:cupredoxin domain-containing protein [Solirubrobacterales bacterium]
MPSARLSGLLLLAAAGATVAAGCGTNNSSADTGSKKPAAPATTQQQAAAPAPTTSSGPVDVKLGEWSITPSAATVKAGKVTFDVSNGGKMPHEMVVLRTNKQAADLAKAGAKRAPEKGNIGEVEDVAPGGAKKLTLKLKPGHYALVCNIDGHWTAGMHADLTVQ